MGKRKKRLAADSVGFALLSTPEAASSLEKRLNRARPAFCGEREVCCSRTDKAAAHEAEGVRCCLELGPLRGYRRREGGGCQGRECRRLIAFQARSRLYDRAVVGIEQL